MNDRKAKEFLGGGDKLPTITNHDQLLVGDRITVADVRYKVHRKTKKDLILRVLKDWEQ